MNSDKSNFKLPNIGARHKAKSHSVHYVVVKNQTRNVQGRRTVFDSRKAGGDQVRDDQSSSSVDVETLDDYDDYDFDCFNPISEAARATAEASPASDAPKAVLLEQKRSGTKSMTKGSSSE